jgi:hypothetical protein
MVASLKHTLSPSFALLFAVGVERFYKILDPVLEHRDAELLLKPDFYIPFTMVAFALLVASLSAVANERFLDTRPDAPAHSFVAFLSYASIFCALVMLYFSVDAVYVSWWWAGYAALCTVNAIWNWWAIDRDHCTPHVVSNVVIAVILVGLLVLSRPTLADPRWFYTLLVLIGLLKWWQRRHERFAHLRRA